MLTVECCWAKYTATNLNIISGLRQSKHIVTYYLYTPPHDTVNLNHYIPTFRLTAFSSYCTKPRQQTNPFPSTRLLLVSTRYAT